MRSRLSRASSLLRLGRGQLGLLLARVEAHQQVPGLTARRSRTGIPPTMPGRSAVTVTPCAAATVPMACRVAGQWSCRATNVVTVSGGIWKDAAWAAEVWICRNFTVPRVAMTAADPQKHHDHALSHDGQAPVSCLVLRTSGLRAGRVNRGTTRKTTLGPGAIREKR